MDVVQSYTHMAKPKSCCKLRDLPTCTTKTKGNETTVLRFQYGKKKNGQWYWHVRAKNSEIIANGEGYKRVAGPLRVFALLFGPIDRAVILQEI